MHELSNERVRPGGAVRRGRGDQPRRRVRRGGRAVHRGRVGLPPRPHRAATGALAALIVLGACDDPSGPVATAGSTIDARLELVADGLDAPVLVTPAPGDPSRLYVVEQPGRIRVIRDGVLLDEPFLDLGAEVTDGGEQGLLGLAFHPNFPFNGWFFVHYTDASGDTRVERYSISDLDVADPSSALEILSVAQPFTNHNGGMLAFGPDGMLYLGLGDGGGAGDPQGHGQDPGTLLGSILRLDVTFPSGAAPYAIPADNPFVDAPDARPEVWAFGLRNPWRFSFDRLTGDLWIGDVGQDRREEISFEPFETAGGLNYGWSILEGSLCFRPATGCSAAGTVLPIYEYGREDGCSVTGGYVYRGRAVPELEGRYVFGDFCSGWIRSFVLEGGRAVDVREYPALAVEGGVASFGEDLDGELYVVVREGRIYRIAPR